MTYTEDSIADALDRGSMTVEEAVELFRGEDVYVYKINEIDPTTATWDEAADDAAGSTIFHSLTLAGATPEQMDEIGRNLKRLSDAGHTTQTR